MKKHISFLWLGMLMLLLGKAQSQNFAPVKDASALRSELTASSQKIESIACDFTQEKNMSMLAEKAVSKGKFYFKKESKVRLEYQQPKKSLIVMNNGKMLMQDDKKTTQMDMHRSKVFQQLNNIIIGSINGSLFTEKDFISKYYETNSLIKVELTPVSKTLHNFISTIVIVLDKKDFTATRIEMNEASGDNTVLLFSEKQINKAMQDSLFAVK